MVRQRNADVMRGRFVSGRAIRGCLLRDSSGVCYWFVGLRLGMSEEGSDGEGQKVV